MLGSVRAQDSVAREPSPSTDQRETTVATPNAVDSLPAWAQTLAPSLPKTTVAMLELDQLHRSQNPLGAELSGKLRWVVADAMDCEYARQYAAADLTRAGWSPEDLDKLKNDSRLLPEPEQAALKFARRLTREASKITDDEVARMLELFSPDDLVGIVHTVALANFQNRIFLALQVSVEADGPLPPLDSRVDGDQWSNVPTPERPNWDLLEEARSNEPKLDRPNWDSREIVELEQSLERQKRRTPRIPFPAESRLDNLPPQIRAQANAIVWSRISMGYQPLLTKAWFDCMGTFQQEAKLNPVFSNSVFWVITRSSDCFY
jgi:alkylhydroperoxidase family enzyme